MFSVVIPLYNKELSIFNTIESVLCQSFKNFEIVIIDDGSTDKSMQVVDQINDLRIRVIQQKNQGVSSARNRGVKEARFDWIAFLDGDDLWESNHLSELQKMIREYPNDMFFATSFRLSSELENPSPVSSSVYYKIDNYFKTSLLESNLVWTSIVVLHKSCIEKVGGFNESLSIGEDLDLWARLSKIYPIIKSTLITAVYRIDAENRSDKGKYPMSRSFLSIIDFRKISSQEEYDFYVFWIIHKLKAFVVFRDYKNILFLLRNYGLYIILFFFKTNKKLK